MASLFTRALDRLTPWDRKGEVQRRQQRKKREDEERRRSSSGRQTPSVDISEPGQAITTPKPKKLTNVFEGLNKDFVLNKPVNEVEVARNQDIVPVPKPQPGTIIKPKQSAGNKIRDIFDANTEADKYRRTVQETQKVTKQLTESGVDPKKIPRLTEKLVKANPDKTDNNTLQSNARIHARSVGSVGSNVAGGFLGITKGVVQLPSAVASTPKLVRLGVAKLTGNKEAEKNIANDKGNLSSFAERYERFVSPVTKRLTRAETATDKAAQRMAPFAPSYVKPTAKVLTNILPVDLAAAGLINLSRARNTSRLIREGEAASGVTGAAGSTSRSLNEVRDLLSEADIEDINTTKIPIGQGVPVLGDDSPGVPISVRNITSPGSPIRELGGDTPGAVRVPTVDEVTAQRAASRFENQAPGRPDSRIEGVITDPARIVTAKDLDETRTVLDDYLQTGKITEDQHKELVDDLSKIPAADAPAPKGQKIDVKMPDTVPVRDETVIPTGLPEIPGTVRATTQTSPMAAKTQAAANAPVVSSSTALPREVQEVLDNPKQFNKRQVAAARNQRKLARAKAKADEGTAEAMERIQTASPAAQSGEGFTPTGEFAKSQNGGTYQKASRKAEMQQAVQETSQMSPGDVLQTARKNQGETGGFNRRDIRNVAALFETKRIARGTPEWNEARQILKEDGTVWGQTGALRNYTMRRTATATQLVERYESKIYRLADDPTKIDSKMFDEVEAAETAFTEARDDALAAYNRFTESPTSANAKLYHAAQDAAEKADKAAKITEYKIANQALKGNKDTKQMRELEKMANEADLYQMDAVDASMLSGTGTFVRNLVNAAVGGAEEALFGGVASRLASRTRKSRANKIKVGGGFGRDSVKGLGEGADNLRDVSMARAGNAGKNPLEHVKNWATTGNQLGDVIIDSQTKHNVLDQYTQMLKEQGYKGSELTDRASVMARQDPDNLGRIYATTARVAAGLGAGVTRGNKIETVIKNMISDTISGGNPNKYTEAVSKLITRMTIGFPTAIGRSAIEGGKRFTLGAPTFIKAFATKDPQARAILVKEGIKQAGTGAAVIPPLFYALGASGVITGAYPKEDKEERARWEREGITENSIRIGDAYYQLPAYLGAWAVPGLFYASLGRSEGDWGKAVADTAKIVPNLLPTDQMTNVTDVINGQADFGKFMAQTGASAVRAATPGGALLNQIAKSFDDTKNDTNSGSLFENFVDKVLSGIPGQHKFANIPDKVDDSGNPIENPNPGELLLGAASKAQTKGEERSNQIRTEVNSDLKSMMDNGVLDDPNLKEILDDEDKALYDKVMKGQETGKGDLKKLKEAFVKGVSSEGTDTAYLEREQYDTNLAVLKLKRDLMKADKSVRPSSIKDIDTAIKRGEVYKENKIPYDLISEYQSVGVDEWRKMGDPEKDEYDPDMYEKLWDIDELMTSKGVSYKKGALDKNKYAAKKPAKGRGSGLGRGAPGTASYSSDFGTLKKGSFAPEVQAYDTIDQKAGSVPVIRRVRPNIVHKIGSSG